VDPTQRACGECTLCCTVLRVDELGKLGGAPCRHLRSQGSGCSIHPTRPRICRAYRCLWLRGSLLEGDRPDRLGALLDLREAGGWPHLAIREAEPGAFERSPRLREIAAAYRGSIPVRITDAGDVMNPEKPYRLLLPGGEEHRVTGDVLEVWREGERVETRRRPWLERALRGIGSRATALRLRVLGRRTGEGSGRST
jgi:hypothetical protein